MRYRTIASSLALSLVLATRAFAADNYEIDPVHSRVGFSVRHLTISNVQGRFMDFAGKIQYDEQDVTKSSVDVKIQAKSVNTENEMRDNDLRSPNFFDVAKYPEISFKSSKVEKQGEGYVLVGTLTMHGVSREVQVPFTSLGKAKDPWGGTRVGFDAGVTINRQDYGLTYAKAIETGGLVVGNDVKIELNIEAAKK